MKPNLIDCPCLNFFFFFFFGGGGGGGGKSLKILLVLYKWTEHLSFFGIKCVSFV